MPINSALTSEARRFREPSLEGEVICHVPVEKLWNGCSDLRDRHRLLRNFPEFIRPDDVVVDSDMPLHQAFRGLAQQCPEDVLVHQRLMRVFYLGVDQKVHTGQVVIHQALVDDVRQTFEVLLKENIPVGGVVPVSDPRFEWDDHSSMSGNNSSGFNYREMITADGKLPRLSMHALGLALDLNPQLNPCFGSPVVHREQGYSAEAAAGYQTFVPANGKYDFTNPSSHHNRHPIVLTLEKLGWTWGGTWGNPKDLHHFQKVPRGWEEWTRRYRP